MLVFEYALAGYNSKYGCGEFHVGGGAYSAVSNYDRQLPWCYGVMFIYTVRRCEQSDNYPVFVEG